MQMSIRDAKAHFAEVAAAAASGERVVVTKHGRPFIELVPAQATSGLDFARAAIIRRELGVDGITVAVPPQFDEPAFSREVLGRPGGGCCATPTSPSGRRWTLARSRLSSRPRWPRRNPCCRRWRCGSCG